MLSNPEKKASLPPVLYDNNYYNIMEYNKSDYILPPPSSLPGYHLPPPYASCYPPPNTQKPFETMEKPHKRKRRQNTEKKYHYQVLELKKKTTTTKKQKRESEAVSAAAATLASFASATPSTEEEVLEDDECVQLEACAGQGGSFQCTFCHSNYKHLNCLQRHGWEHHHTMPKQQKTQLIEAAQILMDIARYSMRMHVLE